MTYQVTCVDHSRKILHTTCVESFAEARALAYKASYAVRGIGFGRKAKRAYPHREVWIVDNDKGVELTRYVAGKQVHGNAEGLRNVAMLQAVAARRDAQLGC